MFCKLAGSFAFSNLNRSGVTCLAKICRNNVIPRYLSRGPIVTEPCRTSVNCFRGLHSDAKDPLTKTFEITNPFKGNLVYVGTLHKMIKLVKTFSLSTSILALSFQPVLLKQIMGHSLSFGLGAAFLTNAFVFATPIMLHFVTKRYVTCMYYNSESGTFTASTYTLLLRLKEHKFTAEDTVIPKNGSIFSSVIVNGKTPLFLDPSLFLDKNAYVTLMKYDEPLDWEIESKDNKDSEPK